METFSNKKLCVYYMSLQSIYMQHVLAFLNINFKSEIYQLYSIFVVVVVVVLNFSNQKKTWDAVLEISFSTNAKMNVMISFQKKKRRRETQTTLSIRIIIT